MRPFLALVAVLAAVALAGCGASTPGPAPAPSAAAPAANAADAAFVLPMRVHHQRALQVGALLAQRGSDPRARAFGERIVAEQTPEEAHLAEWVGTLGLTPTAGDASMALGFIDDAALTRLATEPPGAVDRDALLLSARSEAGAAQMSQAELASGIYPPARALAASIATAPTGEIPALQQLAAALP